MHETSIVSRFRNPSFLLVFSFSPTGLGHLRVTDALYHGLPTGISPVLLGARDASMTYIHRITSLHPLGRSIMEWFQCGLPEDIFTNAYRLYLRTHTKIVYKQIENLLQQRLVVPKTILFVATHFGLAHMLSAIKDKIEKAHNISVFLVVQVTDDTPQHIWFIPGADIIFVPSQKIQERLTQYGMEHNLGKIRFEVIPYPVSPRLNVLLSEKDLHLRKAQLAEDYSTPLHIMIPVSGAAVGMRFFLEIIDTLERELFPCQFHIVAKLSSYTKSFLQEIKTYQTVKLYTSTHDREVVDIYEKVYERIPIALEVTKPSEQAFKALISPDKRGGCILLFSSPVGRQEYDNLDFLARHNLIPNQDDTQALWKLSNGDFSKDKIYLQKYWKLATSWRGVRIPTDSKSAARFIIWGVKSKFFAQMLYYKLDKKTKDNELKDNGVKQFWQLVEQLLEEKSGNLTNIVDTNEG